MDYKRFITDFSQKRKLNPIREIVRLKSTSPPDLIFLAAGIPSLEAIPVNGFSVSMATGHEIKLNPKSVKDALQYGPTKGYPPLVQYLEEFIQHYHSPPRRNDTEVMVIPGAQSGLFASIEMLIQPNDYIITEEPCYSGFISILDPFEPRFIPVQCDSQGLSLDLLREALSHWNPLEMRHKKEGVPKVLYLNPNANNPTGLCYTEERKKEVYKIAREYNLIILEDDPYYFLQFKQVKDYAPSFLSMDVDGRVVRIDSFSKLISSGLRLGFVTGPKPLIERITFHLQLSSLHASGLSQLVVYEILKYWGNEGFLKHVSEIRSIYEDRMNCMLGAADKYLTDLCCWSVPEGGMFLWFQVPKLKDCSKMITERGVKNKVILLPGSFCMQDSSKPCNFLRASYSSGSFEDIEKGIQYLAKLIREELKLEELNGDLE